MKICWKKRVEDQYKGRYTLKGEWPEELKSETRLTFICENHGEFRKHLYQVHRRKEGCPKCSKIGAPGLSNTEFIDKLRSMYPKGFPFKIKGKYKGYHEKILIESKGVDFLISPNHLLRGNRGSIRTTLDKTKFMVSQFKEKHGDFYDYSDYVYKGNRVLSEIICPVHGKFRQNTDVHLMGSGCPSCGQLVKRSAGWSRTSYADFNKGRKCLFYLIRCYNEEEEFFKIGITSSSVLKRYRGRYEMPYNFEILKEVKGEAGEVWDMELEMKRRLKMYHYMPKLPFKGNSTECFRVESEKIIF